MLGFESPRPPKIHPNQVQNVRRCVMNDLKACIAAAVSGRSAEVSIFSRDCALSRGMRGAGGGEGGVDKSTPGGLRGLRIRFSTPRRVRRTSRDSAHSAKPTHLLPQNGSLFVIIFLPSFLMVLGLEMVSKMWSKFD